MESSKKQTFYPVDEVATELMVIPRGRLSDRVNELILKGLALEKQQAVAQAYQTYAAVLANGPQSVVASTSSRYLAEGAFQPEDEEEDFA